MARRKIKLRRRKLNMAAAFRHRERDALALLGYRLRKAFPDPDERLVYIEGLINGLENERDAEL